MNFLETIFDNLDRRAAQTVLSELRPEGALATNGAGLSDLVGSVRSFLRSAGVQPGDRVALLAPNATRWAAVDLGAMAEGAICVPLYSRQAPEELAVMLRDSAPKLLVVADTELERAVRRAWPEACRLARFTEVFESDPLREPPKPREPDACITLIYTSGTSGEPKGAMLTQANCDFMLQRAAEALQALLGERDQDEQVFHYLPWCFAGSRIMLWTQLFRANPLMISTDLNRLVEEMKLADPQYYLNVPTLLERIRAKVVERIEDQGGAAWVLYEQATEAYQRQKDGQASALDRLWLALGNTLVFPRIKRKLGRRLEFLISGSAALSEQTQSWFEMLGVPVYQIYGLTETTAIVTIDDPKRVRAGRVGYPVEGCETRIAQGGELVCRGPNIFAGYWNKPEATEAAFQDGWFRTGDQVELDDQGNLRIVGRVKDLVIPESGHNVAPAPLEAWLVESGQGIEQAVVVGHGKPYLTAVVTGPGTDEAIEEARERLNATLPHYKRIRGIFHAPEPFSIENGLMTANQKLKRSVIEAAYKDEIEGLYS